MVGVLLFYRALTAEYFLQRAFEIDYGLPYLWQFWEVTYKPLAAEFWLGEWPEPDKCYPPVPPSVEEIVTKNIFFRQVQPLLCGWDIKLLSPAEYALKVWMREVAKRNYHIARRLAMWQAEDDSREAGIVWNPDRFRLFQVPNLAWIAAVRTRDLIVDKMKDRDLSGLPRPKVSKSTMNALKTAFSRSRFYSIKNMVRAVSPDE